MKNIVGIYKSDLKKVARNWVALVIMAGLVLLPSLYAWVNIYASWDPYGNTRGVRVGVVNEDEGGTLSGLHFNIGEQVVGTLRENDKLGWTFYNTRDEGVRKAEKGEVYATIIIPRDFTDRMCTLLDANPKKPTLDYYVNEKMNAIAPKMTDSGAATLQKQITASFVETAVKTVFGVLNEVGVNIDGQYDKIEKYKNLLYLINDNFPQLDGRLENLAGKAENGLVRFSDRSDDVVFIQDVLQNLVDFSDGFGTEMLNLSVDSEELSPKIRENLSVMQSVLDAVSNANSELSRGLVTGRDDLSGFVSDVTGDLDEMERDLSDAADRIDELDSDVRGDLLEANQNLSSLLRAYRDALEGVSGGLSDTRQIQGILSTLVELSGEMSTQLNKMQGDVDQLFQDVDRALALCQDISEKLEDVINGRVDDINGALEYIRQKDQELQKYPLYARVSEITKAILARLEEQTGIEIPSELPGLKRELSAVIQTERNTLRIRQNELRSLLRDLERVINSVKRTVYSLQNSLDSTANDLRYALGQTTARLDSLLATLAENNELLADADADGAHRVTGRMRELEPKLGELKNKLAEAEQNVNDKQALETLLSEAQTLTAQLQNAVSRAISALDDDLMPRMQRYLTNAAAMATDIGKLLGNTKEGLTVARDFLDRINSGGEVAVSEIAELRSHLPGLSENLNAMTEKIRNFDAAFDLKELLNILRSDPDTEGDFFAYPVELNTQKLFPMKNYAAGLTPFYTTLCLWVGALLLTALLTTKAKNADFAYTPVEEYFGKYLYFATAALLQGFAASMGDIFVLGVTIRHPVVFVCLAMFYSLVFCMIVYTLVALLGNVGKAIGVVMLVFQLAGSGGTFPIQVTPEFFQHLYGYLPFTYAIGGMREAVAGIDAGALLRDIAVLLVVFVIFLLLGVLLKRFANRALGRFAKKLGESGVIEH